MSTHNVHIRHLTEYADRPAAAQQRVLTTNDKRLFAFIAVAAVSAISVAASLVWANAYYWSVM